MKISTRIHVVMAIACLVLMRCAVPADAQTVSVWITTDNQSRKLQPQTSVAFATNTVAANPVFVDETQTCQPIEGFGAAFTDTTGFMLYEVATLSTRNTVMSNLFTRVGSGIGLSFMRIPMGASDLALSTYSYDDNPPGGTDTNLTYFSVAHDQTYIIPMIQQALQLNTNLTLMANPWSPPGWMKLCGSMINGSTTSNTLLPSMYAPFARYFVKFIQAYAAAGIPIKYISLQNEPLYTPGDYPGMYMDASTQLGVLRDYVLPMLAASNLTTRVLVYDHNWDRPDYPQTVFSDSTVLASSQVAGTAWHGYAGTPGAMLTLAGQYPTKGNYETEHSGGTWVGDQVRSDFEEIIHVMRSWGRVYLKWNLAGDENDGPNTGGCSTCSPLVTVNSHTGAVSYDIDFYTLGHFSKFILPGACRVYSSDASGIVSAAFLNPDGSKVLVAFNDTTSSRTFQVLWGDRSFAYTLASYCGATFTWTGAQSGGYTVMATNQIQASSFNSVSGLETEPTTDTLGGYDVGYADDSDYAVYQNVDFATGITNVTARIACASNGGTLEFRLDGPTGPLISSVAIANTGGWQTWQTVTAPVSGAGGVHNLYVVFRGTTSGIGNLNWFQFGGAFNHQPVLAAISNQTILAGMTLVITNSASDADVPPQTLTFSLLEAPAGAAIDLHSGVFTWRPTIAQSPSVQPVSLAVVDDGTPVLSATQNFTVTVTQPIRPTLSAALMTNSQFEFRINGDEGPDYTIQFSTNLVFWSSLATVNSPTLPFTWDETNAAKFNTCYYRVLLGP